MSGSRVGRWLSWPMSILAIAVVLPLAMLFVLAWLTGWRIQTVETASMEPTVPAGSAVVVEPIDASAVRVGMPIAFRDESRGGQMVTHRVVEVLDRPAGLAFRTQGDANDSPDAHLVSGRAVEGRMRWHIPYLGQALGWLGWPWGFAALVAAPLALLLVSEIAAWHRRRAGGSASRTFAAETRVTGTSAAALPDIAARLRASADATSGNGLSARYLQTLYLPEDERCLYLFEAASPEAVAEAAHGSGLALERVLEAYKDPVGPVRCGRATSHSALVAPVR
jgi:signal peptidase